LPQPLRRCGGFWSSRLAARGHKLGGGRQRVDIDAIDVASQATPDQLLAIDEALEKLRRERMPPFLSAIFLEATTIRIPWWFQSPKTHYVRRIAVVKPTP
jgi:hypothetical protein